ncbi:wall-associated receptor kinase-like 8 [Primulina huaijiensis]|uniref:wall-associated receptor kinase-like 8 n=1 Tax=Primulina huaijiensis TaxID=1492673 RepID=UPI003CC6E44B
MIPGVGSFWIFGRRKIKKLAKLRRNVFESNGGLMLESLLSRQRTATLRVFTAEELKNATDNYTESRILSRSCVFGTVYRGELDDAGENKLVTLTNYHVREEEIKVFIRKLISFFPDKPQECGEADWLLYLSSLTISLENGSTVKIHDVCFTNFCDSSAVLHWMGASGHLDTENLYSGQLIVKSNVYSFGVVQAELIDGKEVNKYF